MIDFIKKNKLATALVIAGVLFLLIFGTDVPVPFNN